MSGVKTIVLQVGVILAVAVGVALATNAVRSDGLDILRPYFEGPRLPGDPPVKPGDPKPPQHGYAVIDFEGVTAFIEDELFELGMYVIIDARDQEHFDEGHIRGAYLLNHYFIDEYMPEVEPVVLGADRVMVYCKGGNCEDSILVAGDLLDIGVPLENICLYEDGIQDWVTRGGEIIEGDEQNTSSEESSE